MRLALGALAASALLAGYSAVSLACERSCDLKPETPAAFDVACMTSDGCYQPPPPPAGGSGQLKPDQSFELACEGGCDHRPEPVVKPFRMASCMTNDC